MNADLAMQRALDHKRVVGFAQLSEEEKTLACIWCFESRVANGGFEHFFSSQEGDLAPYAPTAFRAVGSDRRAEIAERANSVFGPGGVPSTKAERTRALRTLSPSAKLTFDDLEKEYYEATGDLEDRLERYVSERHLVR
ncbi:hypothetical protein DB347_19540 [Opitutaceae bacterium EW11]|nr:hypothetical protein DB347_19540 [Opitutaceae bacterium EW11]